MVNMGNWFTSLSKTLGSSWTYLTTLFDDCVGILFKFNDIVESCLLVDFIGVIAHIITCVVYCFFILYDFICLVISLVYIGNHILLTPFSFFLDLLNFFFYCCTPILFCFYYCICFLLDSQPTPSIIIWELSTWRLYLYRAPGTEYSWYEQLCCFYGLSFSGDPFRLGRNGKIDFGVVVWFVVLFASWVVLTRVVAVHFMHVIAEEYNRRDWPMTTGECVFWYIIIHWFACINVYSLVWLMLVP